MTISERLADFAAGTDGRTLPEDVVQYMKAMYLSVLGSLLWGTTLPAGRIMSDFVRNEGATPDVTVIGAGFRSSACLAAMCSGNAAHAAEWEGDSRPESVGLMTILPVALALAEKYHLDGRTVLEASVIAHEVQARVGLACVPATHRGFFSVPVFGSIGAAVTASRLMGLDREQTRTAMSIAVSQAAGTERQSATMTHFAETGFACRNGFTAALLAAAGLTADKDVFENSSHGTGFGPAVAGEDGFRPEVVFEEYGAPYRALLIDTKHFPCHSLQQCAIEAALSLVTEQGARFADIRSVEVRTNPMIARVLDLPGPEDGESSRFSLQHGVGLALLEGKVGKDTFTDEKAADPDAAAARAKVRIVAVEEIESPAATVMATLGDGRELSASVSMWRGHHANPLTADEIDAKYRDATAGILSVDQVEKSLDMLKRFERVEDVSQFTGVVAQPSGR
jgi:2-methylcitrate dehydratase PrpD